MYNIFINPRKPQPRRSVDGSIPKQKRKKQVYIKRYTEYVQVQSMTLLSTTMLLLYLRKEVIFSDNIWHLGADYMRRVGPVNRASPLRIYIYIVFFF